MAFARHLPASLRIQLATLYAPCFIRLENRERSAWQHVRKVIVHTRPSAAAHDLVGEHERAATLPDHEPGRADPKIDQIPKRYRKHTRF